MHGLGGIRRKTLKHFGHALGVQQFLWIFLAIGRFLVRILGVGGIKKGDGAFKTLRVG